MDEPLSQTRRMKKYAWALAGAWIVAVGSSLAWNLDHQERSTLKVARAQARAAHEKEILYREWSAGHGGVYVPATEETPPNPYLDVAKRDITTTDGRVLTLVNPAYMTRQVNELARKRGGVLGHITSLNPIRAGNAPDPWETDALQAFQHGEMEVSSVEEIDGREYMRLMRPLITTRKCIKCHGAQGYKVGDIRGGISASVPMAPIRAIAQSHNRAEVVGHIWCGLLGLGGIWLATRSVFRRAGERDRAEEGLRSALAEAKLRRDQTTALLKSARAVLSCSGFRESARAIFDRCKNLTKATVGYVALLSKDGLSNEVVFLDSGGASRSLEQSLPMPVQGLLERAYRTGQAVYDNAFSKSKWQQLIPEGHVTLDNVLFAPLILEGKPVGLLGLGNCPGGFTDDDARMASAFGELASVALRNSRTLEALEDSERSQRTVVNASADAMIAVGQDGLVTLFNPAAEQMFGRSAGEMVGRRMDCLMPEDYRETHRCAAEEFLAHGKSRGVIGSTVELTALGADGHEIPIELSLSTGRADGRRFVLATIRDITERRQVESRLRLLTAAVDSAANGVVLTDRSGKIVWVNAAFTRLTGYTFDEAVGQDQRQLQSGESAPSFHGDHRDKVLSDKVWRGELVNRRKDGTRYTEEMTITPVRSERGEIEHFIAIKQDITARKQADEKLHRIQSTVDDATDGILIVEPDGAVSYINVAFGQLFRCTLEMAKENGWESFFAERGTAAEILGATADLDTWTGEVEMVSTRGRCFPAEIRAAPILDDVAASSGVLLFINDITERKKAEEERLRLLNVEQERNHLQDAVKALERVLGVVAHELRTPLAGVRAMAEFLLQEDARETAEFDTFMQSIHDEVVKMSGTVNDTLEVARMNSGTAQWNWSEFGVEEVCEQALETIRPLVDPDKVALSLNVAGGDIAMQGDPGAIRRLVVNLLSNSNKNTSEGSIEVRIARKDREDGPWVEIQVRDTGRGMPPEVAARLGVAFALNSGVVGETNVRGTGLGLAICKGIVAAHGGNISVATNPGEGTTVAVLLRTDLAEPEALDNSASIVCEVAQ